jgi:hypothetical protein
VAVELISKFCAIEEAVGIFPNDGVISTGYDLLF